MRLGGPVFAKYADPEGWVAAITAKGYRAAFASAVTGLLRQKGLEYNGSAIRRGGGS